MIRCKYRIHASGLLQAEQTARALAVEQTVEVPDSLISNEIEANIVGNIMSVRESEMTDPNVQPTFEAVVEFNPELAADQFPQLLNLVYGNTSINPNVKLIDCEFPDSFVARFNGPRFGVEGLRDLLGVFDRPLVCTALKPRGRSNDHFAEIARHFALGGGDLIKDDHNLISAQFDDFADRVRKCQSAVEKASDRTGRRCLYLPYICAPTDQIRHHIEFVLQCGIAGIMVSPMLIGLDFVRALAEEYPILLMSHPTLTGTMYVNPTNGFDPGLFIGTFMRLIGIDASIFTNFGGRFNLSRDDCLAIATHLQRPLGKLAPVWPVPAGGMQFDRIEQMCRDYGHDTILLVGGALLERSPSLMDSTREFMDRARERFSERLT